MAHAVKHDETDTEQVRYACQVGPSVHDDASDEQWQLTIVQKYIPQSVQVVDGKASDEQCREPE